MRPEPVRLTPEEVKKRLGYGALTELRKATGRSLGHISHVVAGRRKDLVLARVIAKKLRVPLRLLPLAYQSDVPAQSAA